VWVYLNLFYFFPFLPRYYVYMCVCACIYVRMYVCMYVCKYACMYVYMCVCLCLCMSVYIVYVCMYICVCVCVICMYVIYIVCVYMCVCMYARTHACKNVRPHIFPLPLSLLCFPPPLSNQTIPHAYPHY